VIGDKAEELVEECDQHMAYAGDNYIPFMVNPYHNQRPLLLNCLELLNVCSSSNDQSIVEACQFVLDNRNSRKATLTVPNDFSLHWLPDKWYKMVTGKSAKSKGKGITEINRKYFLITHTAHLLLYCMHKRGIPLAPQVAQSPNGHAENHPDRWKRLSNNLGSIP